MEAIKNISIGIIHGVYDSVSGMKLVMTIDAEIHKQNTEKETQRQQRLLDRQLREQRTPSPVPSSASAMERESQAAISRVQVQRKNPDERSLSEVLNRPKTNTEEKSPQFEHKIAKQVLKCCLLNGGFTWLSIFLFNHLLMPTLKFALTICYGEHSENLHMVWGWLHYILSIIFGMMWVLPIFLLSKIVSSLWFQDIANAAYRVRKGRPLMIPGISKIIADFLFSLLVQALFLVQSMLVDMLPIPYFAHLLYYVHLSLLYSLYSFEYKWFNSGWELHRRLSYIENNWPYFLGFGLPLTFLTNMTDSIIASSCIFSIFFPLYILSGNEAKPVVQTTDIPLRIFSPVIFVSNLFFNRKDRIVKVRTTLQQELFEQQQQQKAAALQKRREQKQQQEQLQRAQQNKMTPQYRYRQPPTLRSSSNSSVNTTPERTRAYTGMRPLIPTPIAPSSTTSSSSSSLHQR